MNKQRLSEHFLIPKSKLIIKWWHRTVALNGRIEQFTPILLDPRMNCRMNIMKEWKRVNKMKIPPAEGKNQT